MEVINLLFTLDEGYIQALKVALTSIYLNNPNLKFNVFLMHQSISSDKISDINRLTDFLKFDFKDIKVDSNDWKVANNHGRYPKEMYFRLLAGYVLPKDIKKVIYLDPDILVINPLASLYNIDLEENLLAAARHTGLFNISTPINKLRLDIDHGYYNSGIMLINLDIARQLISWDEVRKIIEKYQKYLILPDQDILNFLYGSYILEIPEEIYNYDARAYSRYFAKSHKQIDIQWIMKNTSIIHFCGKEKPWKENHNNKFTALYLTYQNILNNIESVIV